MRRSRQGLACHAIKIPVQPVWVSGGSALRQVESLCSLPIREVPAVHVDKRLLRYRIQSCRWDRRWCRHWSEGGCRRRHWSGDDGRKENGRGGWRRRRNTVRCSLAAHQGSWQVVAGGSWWSGSGATAILSTNRWLILRKHRRSTLRRCRQLTGGGPSGKGLARLTVAVHIQPVGIDFRAARCEEKRQRVPVGVEISAVAVGAEGIVSQVCGQRGRYGRCGRRRRRALLWLQQNRHFAGGQHLEESGILGLCDTQPPIIFDGHPVNGIDAPIVFQRRAPPLGSLGSLGTVGPAGGGDQMILVFQVVGVFPLAFAAPAPGPGAVGVFQRHHVVDIQIAGIVYALSRVRTLPESGGDPAPVVGLVSDSHGGFGYQDLLAGVLTILVLIRPVSPGTAVVFGQIRRHHCNGYRQHQAGRCGGDTGCVTGLLRFRRDCAGGGDLSGSGRRDSLLYDITANRRYGNQRCRQ